METTWDPGTSRLRVGKLLHPLRLGQVLAAAKEELVQPTAL